MEIKSNLVGHIANSNWLIFYLNGFYSCIPLIYFYINLIIHMFS